MSHKTSLLQEYPYLKTIQDLAQARNLTIHLVGGFLRDYFLHPPSRETTGPHHSSLDFDFALKRGAVKFARGFARTIQGAFVLLDQERGCARVVKKKDAQIFIFDFADFRAPTLLRDLGRRDFTINTLCVNLRDLKETTDILKIVRDFKKAIRDIKTKTIRMVSTGSFKEDPLRLMRAFSLRATLNLKIEARTLKRIQKDKELLKEVSYERIRDELFKILGSPRAAENLKAMDTIGLLRVVIPQIEVMDNVPQGGYHHLDVWPHSLETVGQLEGVFVQFQDDGDLREYLNENLAGTRPRYALMKLAGLLHDIGKPETRKKENDRVSFHGHEHVGQKISRSIAKMLKLSIRERHILEDLVRWHLRPGYLSNFKNPSERSIFRYFRDAQEEAASILVLSLADQRSTRGPLTTPEDQEHHEKIVTMLIKRYFEKKRERPLVRLINGTDLIEELKLQPSPLFAKILREVEEKQALGKITNREEALDLAREIAERQGESRGQLDES